MNVRNCAKAIAGFVVPGLAVIGTSLTTASDGGSTVTPSEWVAAALASLATLTAVYSVSNGNSTSSTESVDTTY